MVKVKFHGFYFLFVLVLPGAMLTIVVMSSCTCPLGNACTDGVSTEPASEDHAAYMDSPSESVVTPVDDNTVKCPCGCNEVRAYASLDTNTFMENESTTQ